MTLERLLSMRGKMTENPARGCAACTGPSKFVGFVDTNDSQKYLYYVRCGHMTHYYISKQGFVKERPIRLPRDVATYLKLMWS